MSVDSTLFHYCSADSFLGMLKARALWLSSLTLSNDSMEGRLVNATVLRLAERDKLDVNSQRRLKDSLDFVERYFDGLGFCLSAEGDLLSQWRGYADDARGVSIGFNREYLQELAKPENAPPMPRFSLRRVRYVQSEHESLIEPTCRELRELIASSAFRLPIRSLLDSRNPEQIAADDEKVNQTQRALIEKVLRLMPILYTLKDEAFSEEKEWRLVAMTSGSDFPDCDFRVSRGRVIPYRAVSFSGDIKRAINEVILGPKHQSPIQVVQAMLRTYGFGDVEVRTSRATYR